MRAGQILTRAEWIMRAHPVCPQCRDRQVQCTHWATAPASWRCRRCKHEYSWEPPPGPVSPHSPDTPTP